MIYKKVINNGQVNWDYVETLPEFAKLKQTEQAPKWHSEGNVWIHTNNVVNSLLSLAEYNELNAEEKEILLYAALFHDIGKGVSTKIGDDGEWTSKGHANTGEKITRFMLWDMEYKKRELICHLVKLHMKPKYVTEKDIPVRHVTLYAVLVPIKLLYILSKADTLGATPLENESRLKSLEILDYFKEYSLEADVWNGINHIDVNQHSLLHYINNDEYYFLNGNYIGLQAPKFTVHIMCGVAGSGKDTLIQDSYEILENPCGNTLTNQLPIISLDDIRIELGIKKGKGSKKQESEVVALAKERAKEYCRNQKSFIWNATTIHKMHRNTILNIAKQYNAYIQIHVVEAPIQECINRRKNTIPKDVILKMFESFDYPNQLECHSMSISKQY